jgi:hypothetical protein
LEYLTEVRRFWWVLGRTWVAVQLVVLEITQCLFVHYIIVFLFIHLSLIIIFLHLFYRPIYNKYQWYNYWHDRRQYIYMQKNDQNWFVD